MPPYGVNAPYSSVAGDWARAADTISYEIFTCLRNRIPRLYEHAAEVLPAADLAKLDPATLL